MKEVKTFRAWVLGEDGYEPFNMGYSEEFEYAGEMWVIHRPGHPGNFLSKGWRVSHKETGTSARVSGDTRAEVKKLAEEKINSRLDALPVLLANMRQIIEGFPKAKKED